MVNQQHQMRQRAIICTVWNSHIEYPSRECKHDMKESEGNMFNSIFKENVQGRKPPGKCAFAEPELFSYRKPKCIVPNENIATTIPIIIMVKIMMK